MAGGVQERPEVLADEGADPVGVAVPVEGVVTTYNKPFAKGDHDAITANIPVFGVVKGGVQGVEAREGAVEQAHHG